MLYVMATNSYASDLNRTREKVDTGKVKAANVKISVVADALLKRE